MPRKPKQVLEQLSFIFTRTGFVCDVRQAGDDSPSALAEESQPWLKRFEQDRSSHT